jgi:hypothetical protein
MSGAKKTWDELRGCERITLGLWRNLHFVAPAVLCTALCTAGALAESAAPWLSLPLRAGFVALVAYGCYALWASAQVKVAEERAARVGGGGGGGGGGARAGGGAAAPAAAAVLDDPAAKVRAVADQKRIEAELIAAWGAGGGSLEKAAPGTPGRKGKKA